MNKIRLGRKAINENSLYFIADIAANHNGSLDKAIELIHLCKEAGADAAKFQNFQASKIVSKNGFDSLARRNSGVPGRPGGQRCCWSDMSSGW